MNKAVFLDRDGTIIEEVNYLKRADDIKIFEDAPYALKKLKDNGFLNIIITNQSAIARGFLTIQELEKIHDQLLETLNTNSPVKLIDKIYFCPYHPQGTVPEFSVPNNCRKPATGMIQSAVSEFNIDVSGSFFIGDSYTDMKCAENAGLEKVLVRTGYGESAYNKCIEDNIQIDFFAENIFQASEYIVNKTLNGKKIDK